ncbi:pyroglutamyl-peptidase I [Saccharothrix syringae]|uniref:Pyrrolidone-carboxylate peptidase n=1 Tax=Saccharothrix syringae TaxID=103733 RepID=A0A5Q0GQK3_SACSY|nr:pyroglutamyl-peptidase I [Saccharothrix syringae]QFZ16357.1 pyroglutamyl-peptidase I [Saccharothrix syringae]
MEVLLTGFEPFDGQRTNPSWDAALAVRPDGYALTTLRLPCVFDKSLEMLRAALDERRYDVVVAVGQAGGRAGVTPERVAVNLDDARIPDNAGNQPVDVPVVPGGPAAYFTGLPVKACTAALTGAGIPAAVSHTAGTFVCNHVFYGLMHLVATSHPGLRAGFVHVPFAPEQVADDTPSLPVETTARALELVIRTSLDTAVDLPVTGGTLH